MLQFDSSSSLWLLLLVPLFLSAGHALSRSLGQVRATIAILVRTALMALLILALGVPNWLMHNGQLSVVFLMDRSLSVQPEQVEVAASLVAEELRDHRSSSRKEQVGIVGFAREPAIESPLDAYGFDWQGDYEASLVRDQSDLESALSMARALLPEQGARRVVLVSDGAETRGDSLVAAQSLISEGVGIDVISLSTGRMQDVIVEKVEAPGAVRPATPFDVKVVVRNDPAETAGPVEGQLDVYCAAPNFEKMIASQSVTLTAGTNIFVFREESSDPGFYSYRAQFTAAAATQERFKNNNVSESFVKVTSGGRVLLVIEEGREKEFEWILQLLEEQSIPVDVRPCPLNFDGLEDFQSYSMVIVADVPRYTNADPSAPVTLSDASLQLLRQNVEATGCGLLVIGGPRSFGNGDWKNTALEEILPVNFDVKNSKIQAVTALEIVIDSSGSMEGIKIDLCRAAAREAVINLKSSDYIGVISFASQANEIVKLQKANARELIARLINRLGAGGGTNLYPAMQQAFARLRANPASVRHMLVMTDGRTDGEGYQQLAQQMREAGITISCMAIGTDADEQLLSSIATTGGGQFYKVVSPVAIPRVVISETRRIARPLIFEYESGFAPVVASSHPMLDGIPRDLPPLTGYVLTTLKDNGLVQSLIQSPVPEGDNYPILATWQFGLGRAGAWTTDAGQRWSQSWSSWPARSSLFLQMVRWLMRVEAPADRFHVATQVRSDEVELLLTSFDEAGNAINGLVPSGIVVKPDGKEVRVSLEQIGPGRYRATLPAESMGTHIVSIIPQQGRSDAPWIVQSGYTTQYSDEFRVDMAARHRLAQLAALKPAGGQAGQVVELGSGQTNVSNSLDFFRGGLRSLPSETTVWPLMLVVGATLLLLDVANRRVAWTGLRPVVLPQTSRLNRTSSVPASAHANPQMRTLQFGGEQEVASEPSSRVGSPAMEQPTMTGLPGTDSMESTPSRYAQRLKMAKNAANRRKL